MPGVTNPDVPHLTALLTRTRVRFARPLGSGQPGGDSGGNHGQLRACTRGERLAYSLVELVLGQPILYERGLERVDRLLAVGGRRLRWLRPVARPDVSFPGPAITSPPQEEGQRTA
jgi:hypothetical protein